MKFTAQDAAALVQTHKPPSSTRDVLRLIRKFAKAGKSELILRYPEQELDKAGRLDDSLVKRGFATEPFSDTKGHLYVIIRW